MKPAPFTYHDPRSRADLSGLLAHLENAKLLAGGQSLMPMLNMRIVAPDHVIDLNRMPDMSGIVVADDRIEIGAMTRQMDLHRSAEIAAHLPVMREALDHVGHFQTRSRGTIGGSCCHLDPAAELPAICALYDAAFVVSGANGTRTIAAPDWFQGFLQSALEDDEVLENIRLQLWPMGTAYGFCEYARRHGDFALAGAAALISSGAGGKIARAAIVVFGVASQPIRLSDMEQKLVGATLDADAIRAVAEAARAIEAMSDAYVSADYRRRLAGIMVERALGAAVERARPST